MKGPTSKWVLIQIHTYMHTYLFIFLQNKWLILWIWKELLQINKRKTNDALEKFCVGETSEKYCQYKIHWYTIQRRQFNICQKHELCIFLASKSILELYCKEIIKDKHKVTSSGCVTLTSQKSALVMALQNESACFPGWLGGFLGMICL